MDRLKRWVGMPETVEDNVIGTAISSAAVVLLFRYGWGDSWRIAILIALAWAPIAFAIVEVLRRRRGGTT